MTNEQKISHVFKHINLLSLCVGIPADVDFKSAHFSSSRRFFERNSYVSKTVCIGMLLASSAQPQQGCQPPPPPHIMKYWELIGKKLCQN